MKSLVLLVIAGLACACGSTVQLKRGDTYKLDSTLAMSREAVFQALTTAVHGRDVAVDEIDQAVGLLTLKPQGLTAAKLDEWCVFPVLDEEGKPTSTFTQTEAEALEEGQPALEGTLELSFLVTSRDAQSATLNIKSRYVLARLPIGGTERRDVVCASRGVLEASIVADVKAALLAVPGTTPAAAPATP